MDLENKQQYKTVENADVGHEYYVKEITGVLYVVEELWYQDGDRTKNMTALYKCQLVYGKGGSLKRES